MKKRRLFCGILILGLLAQLLAVGVSADGLVTGSAEKRTGYDVAAIRYVLADGSYGFAEFTETEQGYTYSFPRPDGSYTVIPEYFSIAVWDGAVDISWYDPNASVFYLDTPAKLAGLAALVNGRTDAGTPDYRIKGDRTLFTSTRVDDFLLVGAGGGNQKGTVYVASPAFDFSDKTICLTADMDMGGTANWTPIGGKYPMDAANSEYVIEAFFNGVLDGQGHRIYNLSCDRYAAKGYAYSQAVGLVGYLGELYDGESAPACSPSVRNLSVSGSIYGRRMVGGIVGRVGSIPTGVSIENCANFASVKNTDSKGIGGIVGAGWGTGVVVNCYNAGSVTTTYACPAGGICGSNSGGLDISCCYNVGQIDSNGNGRARAIGSHDSGSYTVSDCYYLSGCDDDPSSNGRYVGTALNISVSVGKMTEAEMKSQALVDRLNVNGSAYVLQEGGYPILFWEQSGYTTANCAVSFAAAEGGSISADCGASVPSGTVLKLSNTPQSGYSFRSYTLGGTALTSRYVTIRSDSILSGIFVPMVSGVLYLQGSTACTLTVTKTGTALIGGVLTSVRDYPVSDGDSLYEGDVLTAKATLSPDAAPDDLNYVYNGKFQYLFTFQDEAAAQKATDTGTFTVPSNITTAALLLCAVPYTTHKVWTQLAETGWYTEGTEEFTLTTARQLAGLALLVKNGNRFAGKTIRLGADISLANDDKTYNRSVRWWDGIGSVTMPFSGTFDGCGHTITEMTAVSTGSNSAFFLATDGAVVKNLTVSGTVSANGVASGITAQAARTVLYGCVNRAGITSSGEKAGGIVASADDSVTVQRCSNYGAVVGTEGVGGIAGTLADSSTLTGCFNLAPVSGSGSSGGVGGIAGRIGGMLDRCANYGAVSGAVWYLGGVAGLMNTSGVSALTDCYNAGAVVNTSTYTAAGTGGLVGYGNYYALKNCFDYGSVTAGSGSIGGILGKDSNRFLNSRSNLYFLDTACSGGNSLSGVQAQSAALFASSAFLTQINQDGCFALVNGQYPELKLLLGVCDGETSCPGKCFTDMPSPSNWAHSGIDFAVAYGLFQGTSPTTFSPGMPMTRCMLVTVLWSMTGKPTASAAPGFSDVSSGRYYFKAVAWAAENNIVAGIGGGSFNPNGNVTREQIAAILLRYAAYRQYAGLSGTGADLSVYKDAASVSAYAVPAMQWAVGAGLIRGTSIGNDVLLDPKGSATRAQVAAILMRFVQNLAG